MIKFFLVCTLLIGGMTVLLPEVQASESLSSISATSARELPDDARSITVYKVVKVGGNAWSSSPVSAIYSRSENSIYVNEGRRQNQPYTISANPAYKQQNDGRGEFRYRAGDYFFNL